MFLNPETTVLSELLKAGTHMKWNAVTQAFLRCNGRKMALEKLAEAVRWFVYDHTTHADPVTAEFCQHALTKVDFALLAQTLVESVEAADKSVGRTCRAQNEESAIA